MKRKALEDKIQELTLQLQAWKADPKINPQAIAELEKALRAFEQEYRDKHIEN